MNSTYQILYWYDIPVQVRAKQGRKRHSIELSPRFQVAIDKAAMDAGLTGSEAYTDQFRWSDHQEMPGGPEAVAQAVATELEARHTRIDWRRTVASLKGEVS